MLDRRKFYIKGEWVESQGGREHHVIDPSTEEPCATITLGSEADAKAAEAAPKLPAKPQPQLVLLPKTGVTAWRGCEPPKEDLSIADLAEAFAG